jgi:hypothetical protein
MNGNAPRGGLNLFYVLNLSLEKPYYQGGYNFWLNLCDQMLKLYSKYPHTSAKTVSSTIPTLCCLGGCGSAAPKERQCRTLALPHLSDRWKAEVFIFFPASSNVSPSSPTVQTDEK